MGRKKFFNFKSLFLASFLAIAGIFSAGAFAANNQIYKAEAADGDPVNLYLRGTMNNWAAQSAYQFVQHGTDVGMLKNVYLKQGQGFKLDGAEWGQNVYDSTKLNNLGTAGDKFYHGARAGISWKVTNDNTNPIKTVPTTETYVAANSVTVTCTLPSWWWDANAVSGLYTNNSGSQEYKYAQTSRSGNTSTWTGVNLETYNQGIRFYRAPSTTGSWWNSSYYYNIWNDNDNCYKLNNNNIVVLKTGYYDIYVNNEFKISTDFAVYVITFNPNGGSCEPKGKEVTWSDSATYGDLPTPTRPGYTFDGWYTDASGGTKVTSSSALAENANHTIYAHWVGNTYSIGYNLNGGSHGSTHPTSGTFGTAFYVSAPSKTGFTFTGWTVTAGLNSTYAKWGTTSSPSTTITDSSTKCVNGATGNVYFLNINESSTAVTLTANWDPNQYTYTTGNLPTGVESLTCTRYSSPNKGASTGTVSSGDPVYYGDTLYWTATASTGYTITTLNHASISDLYTVGTSGDISGVTVTSVAASGNPYTVTLDQQSGSGGTSSVTATFGSAMPSGKNAPSRTGYIFGGYYGSTGGSGTQYYDSSMASTHVWDVASNTSIYAKWTAKTSALTFAPHGGTGAYPAPGILVATYGQNMPTYSSDPLTAPEGYTFGGYWTGENGTGTCYYDSSYQSATTWVEDTTDGTTLHAYWIAKTTTVTFEKNGGEGGSNGFTATYDAAVPDIAVPTKTGYTFQGYYTEGGYQIYTSTGKGGKIWGDDSATATLYARWNATTYNITYALNGGSHGSTHPSSGTYDTVFYVSAPTKTGYTFTGWTVTSGLNSSTAKWGTTDAPATQIASSSTLCVNGASGNVYFKNINAAGTAVQFTANWTPNTDTPYTVNHYQQNLDGSYPSTPTETDNLTGTTGEEVTPDVNTYTGFTGPSAETVTIAADGSTVVDYYYTRNGYLLQLHMYTGVGTIYYKFEGASEYSSTTRDTNVWPLYGQRVYLYATANAGYKIDNNYTIDNPLVIVMDEKGYNWTPTATSGESAAIAFATSFNTRVGGICVYAGGTNFNTLKTEWNGTQQTAYNNNLEDYQKYWLDKNHASSDKNVQDMFAMYDYIAHKYGTGSGDDKLHDFLNRNNGAQAAAVNNFSPFDYFTNDENNLSTLIIVIASSISLLSITALSVLMVKKRKRKEQ